MKAHKRQPEKLITQYHWNPELRKACTDIRDEIAAIYKDKADEAKAKSNEAWANKDERKAKLEMTNYDLYINVLIDVGLAFDRRLK